MIQVIRQYPCNIREIVKKARENGETKLAIADRGVMFNVPRFYRECVNNKIVPIIGCEFPLDNGKCITLFAKDNEGYKNLMFLSSMACATLGTFEKPKLKKSFLSIFSKGLTENQEEVSSFEIERIEPQVPGEKHEDVFSSLQVEVVDGYITLIERGKIPVQKRSEYEKRLYYEFSIIDKGKFANYFLFISDCVKWAKQNDCGPCTVFGNASNSLVLYCLGISDLDPIENSLLFERFINPDRLVLPEIDITVPAGSREKIYNYLKETYGEGCVAQSASLSLDGSYIGCNPREIIISKSDLATTVPVFINENGKLTTQYPAWESEDYGPIKFDIYENVNLSIIKEAEKKFKIPLCDKETFEMLKMGDSDNIEYFSLPEEKKNLKRFKPDSIIDLAILYAFDRPGGFDAVTRVFENKVNNTSNKPAITCIKPILEQTYGCFVFQEQFVESVCIFTGWDRIKADKYRKTIAQRRRNLREEYEKDFIESALSKGHSKKECTRLIHDFDSYTATLFPKNHALQIASVAYKVAYVKCHAPELFEKITQDFESTNTNLLNVCEGEYINNYVSSCFVKNKKTQQFGQLFNMRILGNDAAQEVIKRIKTDALFILIGIGFISQLKEYQNINQLFKDGWHYYTGSTNV